MILSSNCGILTPRYLKKNIEFSLEQNLYYIAGFNQRRLIAKFTQQISPLLLYRGWYPISLKKTCGCKIKSQAMGWPSFCSVRCYFLFPSAPRRLLHRSQLSERSMQNHNYKVQTCYKLIQVTEISIKVIMNMQYLPI